MRIEKEIANKKPLALQCYVDEIIRKYDKLLIIIAMSIIKKN